MNTIALVFKLIGRISFLIRSSKEKKRNKTYRSSTPPPIPTHIKNNTTSGTPPPIPAHIKNTSGAGTPPPIPSSVKAAASNSNAPETKVEKGQKIIKIFPETSTVFADNVEEHEQFLLPVFTVNLNAINPEWQGELPMVLFFEDPYMNDEEREETLNEYCKKGMTGFDVVDGKLSFKSDFEFFEMYEDFEYEFENIQESFEETQKYYRKKKKLPDYCGRPGRVYEQLGGMPDYMSENDIPLDPDGNKMTFITRVSAAQYWLESDQELYLFYSHKHKLAVVLSKEKRPESVLIKETFPESSDVFADRVKEHEKYLFPIFTIDLNALNPEWEGQLPMVLYYEDPYNKSRVKSFNDYCNGESVGFDVIDGKLSLKTDLGFFAMTPKWRPYFKEAKEAYLSARDTATLSYEEIGRKPKWIQGDATPLDPDGNKMTFIVHVYASEYDIGSLDFYLFYSHKHKLAVMLYQTT